jgi:acyl-CoA dehydrogenase
MLVDIGALAPLRNSFGSWEEAAVHRWTLWNWPFFEDRHKALADRVAAWTPPVDGEVSEAELPAACRELARSLADHGFLDIVVPTRGETASIDVRALCVAREGIAYKSVLADTVIAMQGIGTGALWMHGSEEQKARYLGPARRGEAIAAFALTEPDSGSDVANITTHARRDGDHYVINGDKTFISNAITISCWRAPVRRPAPRACRPSSSMPARRASKPANPSS